MNKKSKTELKVAERKRFKRSKSWKIEDSYEKHNQILTIQKQHDSERSIQSAVLGENNIKRIGRPGSTSRDLNLTISNLPSLDNLHRIGNIRSSTMRFVHLAAEPSKLSSSRGQMVT
jgi:hypothetical protein